MARQVFADPFGSYIQGYDTGAQREMALQRGVRDARGMDWDFYNMKPLELQTAQRTNEFQQFADPFQRQMLPIGVQNARNTAFMGDVKAAEIPAWYGITDPTYDAIARQYGYGRVGTPDATQFYGANGEPISPVLTPEDVSGQYLRGERREIGNEQFDQQLRLRAQMLQEQQIRMQAEQQARLYEELRLKYGAGAGQVPYVPWLSSLFGEAPTPEATAPIPQAPQAPSSVPPYLYDYGIGSGR